MDYAVISRELQPTQAWLDLDELDRSNITSNLFTHLVMIAAQLNMYEVAAIAAMKLDPYDQRVYPRVVEANKLVDAAHHLSEELLYLCVHRGEGQLREDGTQSKCHMLQPFTFEDACQEVWNIHLAKSAIEKTTGPTAIYQKIMYLVKEYLSHNKRTDPAFVLRSRIKADLWALTNYKEHRGKPVSELEKLFNVWFLRTEQDYA